MATILVIDDDPMVRTVMARVLMTRGYKVLEAGGVDEELALCAALGDTLDLLIADLALPSVREQPLTDRLVHRCPNTKILYISAWPYQILRTTSGIAGTSHVFAKALQGSEARKAVETVLQSPAEGTRTHTAGS